MNEWLSEKLVGKAREMEVGKWFVQRQKQSEVCILHVFISEENTPARTQDEKGEGAAERMR